LPYSTLFRSLLTGSIVGLKNGDGITASYSTAATAAGPAGSYDIVPAAVDSDPSTLGNYTVMLVKGTLSIGKAALTITAEHKTKVYGQANPAFTVSYDGFVNGDDANSLGGTLGFDTAATTTSDVGSYDVTPNGL